MTHESPPDQPANLTGTARALVLVAGLIISVEAIAYLSLAALDLRDSGSGRLSSGIGVAVILIAYGVAQLVAVRFLLRGAAAARSPLVVTQVLQLLVATGLRDSSTLALSVAVPAVVVLACVLAPPVTRAVGRV
ncbi:hypothetical protein [Aeromicrobium sp. CF3.5]|uniref:hypothetical protein n=1 Tax=Aeromicrobium sp. CF3.5 TaxID=3373078 RepID=UPI003EE7B459